MRERAKCTNKSSGRGWKRNEATRGLRAGALRLLLVGIVRHDVTPPNPAVPKFLLHTYRRNPMKAMLLDHLPSSLGFCSLDKQIWRRTSHPNTSRAGEMTDLTLSTDPVVHAASLRFPETAFRQLILQHASHHICRRQRHRHVPGLRSPSHCTAEASPSAICILNNSLLQSNSGTQLRKVGSGMHGQQIQFRR